MKKLLQFRHRLVVVVALLPPASTWGTESDGGQIGGFDHITRPVDPEYRIHGDGSVSLTVCFNWSCRSREPVTFTADDLSTVSAEMARCGADRLYDRLQRIRIGIWQMELAAQKYIPVLANDQAVNDKDADLEGRTDCVDNTTNTSTYLRILSDLSLIPGWRVSQPEVRAPLSLEAVHWTAVVTDIESGENWTVDSWFRPHGHLPFVQPVGAWLGGEKAWEPPFDALNPYPAYIDDICPEERLAKRGPAS